MMDAAEAFFIERGLEPTAIRRESFDLVTARSFARPAVTAEIGAGLARPGGMMVVSEPPTGEARWPEAALADLGYGIGTAPVAERLAGEVLSLPCYPELGDDEVQAVAAALVEALSK